MAEKPRRQDTAVVQHQQIIGAEKLRKIPKAAVFPSIAVAIYVQHARVRAIREWMLGNQLFGKVVLEVGNQHRSIMTERTSGSSGLAALPRGDDAIR